MTSSTALQVVNALMKQRKELKQNKALYASYPYSITVTGDDTKRVRVKPADKYGDILFYADKIAKTLDDIGRHWLIQVDDGKPVMVVP
jgi:hypothetical protein